MIWIILAVYLGGFVAVLGVVLADSAHLDSLECFAMAGSWPVAWVVVLVEYFQRRATDRRNKAYLAGQRSPKGESE